MKCFYHNDMDGKCAGAIVYKYYVRDRLPKESYEFTSVDNCEFISIDYKNDFPFDSIGKDELVVIVDFSLQKPGDFKKLLDITSNVIWIDHHKTAIEMHGDINVEGIRKDGVAGCVLAWEYFYPNIPIPTVVKLLGDYDIWKFEYGDDTRNLQEGIKMHENKPDSDNWIYWLENYYDVAHLIRDGRIVLEYRDNYYRNLVSVAGFFTRFHGYKAIACNAGLTGSNLFNSIQENYDLMIPFYFDGKQWVVSIYSENKNVDCSEIAKKYGGGGHKNAAGFQCKELPFFAPK